MSISLLRDKFVKVLEAVPEERRKQAIIAGNDSIALIRKRIINDGVGADGNKFPKYSTKPMPYWKLNELDPRVSNKASGIKRFKEDAAKGKINPSYETLRQYMGLPTDKRTHVFTGEMMQSIFSEIESHDKDQTTIIIKSSDEENQKKLNFNSSIVKINLLALSDDERRIILESSSKRLRKLLSL